MPNRVRPIVVRFYINKDEENILLEKINASGLKTKNDYLRRMALNGYVIKPNYEYSKKIVYELNKIGNNLNQISAKINANGDNESFRKELSKWGKELDDLWQLHMLEWRRIEKKIKYK